jgi:hypothetical protein
MVLIELDRIILKHRGRNPIEFASGRLRQIGLTHHTRMRALQQLAAADVIKIEQRGAGFASSSYSFMVPAERLNRGGVANVHRGGVATVPWRSSQPGPFFRE